MIVDLKDLIQKFIISGKISDEEKVVFEFLARQKYSELYKLCTIYKCLTLDQIYNKITFFLSDSKIEKRKEIYLNDEKKETLIIFNELYNHIIIDLLIKSKFI